MRSGWPNPGTLSVAQAYCLPDLVTLLTLGELGLARHLVGSDEDFALYFTIVEATENNFGAAERVLRDNCAGSENVDDKYCFNVPGPIRF